MSRGCLFFCTCTAVPLNSCWPCHICSGAVRSPPPLPVQDMMEREKISLSCIRTAILDEADRMLDMGFEKDIRQILTKTDIPRTGRRQTLMFSATFPKSIQQLASDFLSNYVFLTVGRVGAATELVTQHLLWVEESRKKNYLLGMLMVNGVVCAVHAMATAASHGGWAGGFRACR